MTINKILLVSLVLFSSLVLLYYSKEVPAISGSCVDSDIEDYPSIKTGVAGTVTWTSPGGQVFTYDDYCFSIGNGSAVNLQEYYCTDPESGVSALTVYNCGCVNGACTT